ncbi:hypothetical protein ACMFMF_004798 [Clarireedia jacksonii]
MSVSFSPEKSGSGSRVERTKPRLAQFFGILATMESEVMDSGQQSSSLGWTRVYDSMKKFFSWQPEDEHLLLFTNSKDDSRSVEQPTLSEPPQKSEMSSDCTICGTLATIESEVIDSGQQSSSLGWTRVYDSVKKFFSWQPEDEHLLLFTNSKDDSRSVEQPTPAEPPQKPGISSGWEDIDGYLEAFKRIPEDTGLVIAQISEPGLSESPTFQDYSTESRQTESAEGPRLEVEQQPKTLNIVHDTDQSMHVNGCDGECPKIPWNKQSYEECATAQAPRAVKVVSKKEAATVESMTYVPADRHTLAISHVWKHGQGGRPETGINTCLYRWYSSLAAKRQHGVVCRSFWIDAACIPEDYRLRMEAILSINDIFAHAGKVVIIDRDIMKCTGIYVGSRVASMKILLETWASSNWNQRAWTMLEGIRGWKKLHLLCKDDKMVSQEELARRLKLDLQGDPDRLVSAGSERSLFQLFGKLSRDRDLTFDFAGSLLAQREASRRQDIPVIWSLLCGRTCSNETIDDMSKLVYEAGIRTGIRTCFLMNGMQRLEKDGYRWGPAAARSKYPREPYDGLKHERCHIGKISRGSKSGGLTAVWLVHELTVNGWPGDISLRRGSEILDIRQRLHDGHKLAIIQAAHFYGHRCFFNVDKRNFGTWNSPIHFVALCSRVMDETDKQPAQYIWEDICMLEVSSQQRAFLDQFTKKKITIL